MAFDGNAVSRSGDCGGDHVCAVDERERGRAFGFHLAQEQSEASIAETIEPPPEGKLDRATVLAERLAENGPSARLGT